MIRPKLTNICLCLMALLPAAASALPNDQQQPLHISSDTAEVDDLKGISIYRGAVYITQGSIKLKAKKVTIYSNNQGISKLVAIGSPAHFQQLPESGGEIMHAFGNTIEYYVAEERIKLKKQAKLEQEKNVFTGERIDYDIKRRVVNAYSDSNQGNSSSDSPRVNLVIQPNKINNSDKNKNSTNE